MNVTEEVTTHRPNPTSAFIRVDLNAATRNFPQQTGKTRFAY